MDRATGDRRRSPQNSPRRLDQYAQRSGAVGRCKKTQLAGGTGRRGTVSNAGEGSDRPAARSDCKIEKTFGRVKAVSSSKYLAGRSKRTQMQGARLTDERRRTV